MTTRPVQNHGEAQIYESQMCDRCLNQIEGGLGCKLTRDKIIFESWVFKDGKPYCEKYEETLEAKVLRLKGLLRRAQTQLDYIILATPTGEKREELTQLNIEIQAELEDV